MLNVLQKMVVFCSFAFQDNESSSIEKEVLIFDFFSVFRKLHAKRFFSRVSLKLRWFAFFQSFLFFCCPNQFVWKQLHHVRFERNSLKGILLSERESLLARAVMLLRLLRFTNRKPSHVSKVFFFDGCFHSFSLSKKSSFAKIPEMIFRQSGKVNLFLRG